MQWGGVGRRWAVTDVSILWVVLKWDMETERGGESIGKCPALCSSTLENNGNDVCARRAGIEITENACEHL